MYWYGGQRGVSSLLSCTLSERLVEHTLQTDTNTSVDANARSEVFSQTCMLRISTVYLERDFGRVPLCLGQPTLVVRLLHDLDHRPPENVLVGERQRGTEPKHLHTRLPLGVWGYREALRGGEDKRRDRGKHFRQAQVDKAQEAATETNK